MSNQALFVYLCWSRLPQQQHIKNTSYHYGIISSNDFTYNKRSNFKKRLDKHYPNGNTVSSCDIKSVYANIQHDLIYTAVEYWIEKLQDDLHLLRGCKK